MPRQTTGEFLCVLRKAAGLTQEDVAEKLNISNRTISSWETDRTMPDVLLLPAIADLYGVTVDEILRGERAQPNQSINNELTEKSVKASRKHRLGKFSARCNLLCAISCICAALAILACFLLLFRDQIFLTVLTYVIGYAGIAICITVAFYLANGVKLAEGLVFKEDLTEDTKSLVFAVNRKLWQLLMICSIPFWIASVFFVIVFIMSGLNEIVLICPPSALVLSAAGIILYFVTVKKYGNKRK